MGETYEQFTHINLKRQQGQFFTNRLVVNMMVKMLDPIIGERTLDPAGGSGGFSTGMFRYLRRKVIENSNPHTLQRERMLSTIKDSVFLVEIAKRLVKIAKCAMLMTGDGQSGMTRGNSLDAYDKFDPWIQARCCKGKLNAPDVIATNPPSLARKSNQWYLTELFLSRLHSVIQQKPMKMAITLLEQVMTIFFKDKLLRFFSLKDVLIGLSLEEE